MSEPAQKKRGFFGRLFGTRGSDEPAPPSAGAETAPAVMDRAEPQEPETAPESSTIAAVPIADVQATPEALATVVPEPAVPTPSAPAVPEPPVKKGWFQRLKEGLTKTSSKLSDGITGLFTKRKLDADTLDELEDLLIQADLGVDTAMRITEALSKGRYDKGISPEDVKTVLAGEVERVLMPVAKPLVVDGSHRPHIILVVGVNGTGKTTTIGKLANQYAREGKKVLMAAGDTFRAAAIDQLKIWGERTGATVLARNVGADASGLAFDAVKDAQAGGHDVVLIDTAGRLQNKQALMEELEKVIRVMRKVDPTAPHDVLLVLDATTGQNALSQVEVFQQKAGVTGLVMTKLDGTARGGILVAIAAKFAIPVHYIGVGEGVDDLQPFKAEEFARAIALN